MRNQKKLKPSKKTKRLASNAAVSNPNTVRENQDEKSVKNLDWVPFFKEDNNTFPNDLALRAQRSSIHNSICQSKINYIIGKGFQWVDENGDPVELSTEQKAWVNSCNSDGESLLDVYSKFVSDFVYIGNASLQRAQKDGSLGLFHHDVLEIRKGRVKKGKVETAYISRFWKDIKLNTPTIDYPVDSIPMYNGEESSGNYIVYLQNYSQGFFYYGLPQYVGALHWIDIEYKIPRFNLKKFDNGFFPSVYIALKGEPPDGYTAEQYVKKVVNKFTGEDNNDKIFAELLDDPTAVTDIHEFQQNKEGEFTELQQLVTQNIISAHQWDASLSGIMVGGKLGENDNIRKAYELAESGVIAGLRNPTLRTLNENLPDFFNGIKAKIIKKAPVSFAGDVDINAVMSNNEKRETIGLERDKETDVSIRMNGAQVTGMVNVVAAVSRGELTEESGAEILKTAFGVTEEQARKIATKALPSSDLELPKDGR